MTLHREYCQPGKLTGLSYPEFCLRAQYMGLIIWFPTWLNSVYPEWHGCSFQHGQPTHLDYWGMARSNIKSGGVSPCPMYSHSYQVWPGSPPRSQGKRPVLSFSSVQSLSHVRFWIAACQASLSITSSWRLLKLMSKKSVMPSSHLILCCPLLLLPPNSPSIRVFSNESTLRMRWPKFWSFSFSISPANEHPGLISFRMEWLDLLAIQGPPSPLQHHS